MKIAVYPGTFNPISNGHTDLVERASRLFDQIIVAVGTNAQKYNTMTTDRRVELAQEVLGHIENVRVQSFDTLLTEKSAPGGRMPFSTSKDPLAVQVLASVMVTP